jgi:hypothetical protein
MDSLFALRDRTKISNLRKEDQDSSSGGTTVRHRTPKRRSRISVRAVGAASLVAALSAAGLVTALVPERLSGMRVVTLGDGSIGVIVGRV